MGFTEESSHGTSGGAATSIDGIISTRRGNAGTWMSFIGQQPFGEWELAQAVSVRLLSRHKRCAVLANDL